MSELDKETKEFFESGGEKAPVETKDEPKAEVPKEVKTEDKAEVEVKKEQKEEPKAQKEVTKEEPKDDDDPHAENHRKALKETRAEMKRLKKEKLEAEEKSQRELGEMREKFKAWTEAVNRQSQPEPAKFEEDPANHLKQEHEMTKKELSELKAWKQQQEQAYAQQHAMQQFQNKLQAEEQAFAKEVPDYDEAAKHVANIWTSEFRMAGVPPEQIGQAYFFKVAQFANAAIRRGENPAEAVYELAQMVGYQKKEVKKPAGEQKIETIQKGQEAAKGLGGGKDSEFSLEMLAGMSQSDIDSFVANPKNWKKLA